MKKIEAPVTGRVIAVQVAVGQTVQIGDEVARIESMKMEIPVEAEHDGVVAGIHVEVDGEVEEGQAVVSLEGGA